MEKLTHITLEISGGGWVKAHWWRRGVPERTAWLQFKPPGGKRKGAPQPRWKLVELRVKNPTGEGLAEIPLDRIERAVNALTSTSDELLDNLDKPMSADLDAETRELFLAHPREKFERPAGRQIDEAFLRSVAFSYRDAVVRGLNPTKTMAEESGAPYSTVAKWIARARLPENGYLPPPEHGKASG